MEENQQSPKPAPAAPSKPTQRDVGLHDSLHHRRHPDHLFPHLFHPVRGNGSGEGSRHQDSRRATVKTVEDSVAKYLGADYSEKVAKAAKLTKADFSRRHGAYPIEEGMSPAKACHRLMKGAQHPLMLTINGFRSADLLAQEVARRLDFTADSLLNAMSDPRR